MESWLSRSSDWVPLAYFATIFGLYLVSELPTGHLGSESPGWPSVRSGQGPQSHLPGPQGSFSNAGSNYCVGPTGCWSLIVRLLGRFCPIQREKKSCFASHITPIWHSSLRFRNSCVVTTEHRSRPSSIVNCQIAHHQSSFLYLLRLIDYTVCRNQVCTDERRRPPGIYLS